MSAATTGIETIGAGPAAAMSMTYAALAASIGLVLQNAADTQHSGQILAASSTATTCALIASTMTTSP